MLRFLFTFLLCIFLNPDLLWAETLVSRQNGKLKFELAREQTSYLLSLRGTGQSLAPEQVNILKLDNPARLVVDISGEWNCRAQEIPIKGQRVKSLRIGVHPGSVRLVVDLNQVKAPDYELEDAQDALRLTFGGATAAIAPVGKLRKLTEIPKIEAAPTDSQAGDQAVASHTTNGADSQMQGRLSGDIPAPAAATPKPPAQGGGPLIENILFEREPHEQAPAISIQIQNLGQYTLTKRKDNLYQLSIQSATLSDPNLVLPQFPPTDYSGLEVVVAEQHENTVLVSMYVETGTFLTPFREGNKLWVRVGK